MGIFLDVNQADGSLFVSELVPGGPAVEGGQIRPGDVLIDVDGYDVVGRPVRLIASEATFLSVFWCSCCQLAVANGVPVELAGPRCAESAVRTTQFAGDYDPATRWQIRGAARCHSAPRRSRRQCACRHSSSITYCAPNAGARCITSAARAGRNSANGPAAPCSRTDGSAWRNGEGAGHRIQKYLFPLERRAAGPSRDGAGGLERRPLV